MNVLKYSYQFKFIISDRQYSTRMESFESGSTVPTGHRLGSIGFTRFIARVFGHYRFAISVLRALEWLEGRLRVGSVLV